jgi:hypothetical protein
MAQRVESLARQVSVPNRIAETIALIEPRAVDVADQVTDVHKLLTAIAGPPAPPAKPRPSHRSGPKAGRYRDAARHIGRPPS